MLELDAVELARMQFALNISFHILFPAITIGLAWVLLYFRVRYTLSGNQAWEFAYYFWVKVFALSFALGVVSGVTMSFQFGTNWPGFIERAGNIAGPLLGYEVLTAFFMEAAFLGVMLFGKERVSNAAHLAASAAVAAGTTFSAFWIMSLNSWMQTPQGHEIVDGVFYARDWMAIIFNPSFPYRFTHMVIASLLTTAFLISGISAWRMIKRVDGPATRLVLATGVWMAAVLAPVQLVVGDLTGLNTFEHQPAKLAAIEGIWETQRGAPFTVFGLPDQEAGRTGYAIEIPNLTSFLLTHDWHGEITGLDEFGEDIPPVGIVFWSFRVMVGTGLLMIAVSWWSAWHVIHKHRYPRRLLAALSFMTFSGWVATLAGWYVAEVGRQPWLVYGLFTTADAAAPHAAGTVGGTLAGYFVLYAFLLASYIGALRHLSTKPAASLALLSPLQEQGGPATE